MSELYIGLISGTSMDGIDVVLVDLAATSPRLIKTQTTPYPDSLAEQLRTAVAAPEQINVRTLGQLDALIGDAFASSVNQLLDAASVSASDVTAIGSHGQNVCHSPDSQPPFTLQIGDANRIAEQTGITTVADFRRRDVAAGGQGAPLAPALHQALFRGGHEDRAVLNLGGIANLTLLPADPQAPVHGFDTGPASCLIDEWVYRNRGDAYDANGDWAAQGQVDDSLLARLQDDPYFARAVPKSTGREHFNLDWVEQQLGQSLDSINAVDLQRTLLELTALTIATQLGKQMPGCQRLLVCGGGVHNGLLLNRLRDQLSGTVIESTSTHGIDPDYVEATLFAWLAQQAVNAKPGNIVSVTGAAGTRVLGGIYPG